MSSQHAPLQGFGQPITAPDYSGNVFFTILLPQPTLAQWAQTRNVKLTPIPGSNPPIVEEEVISHTRSTVTWRLELASIADLRRLHRMVGTTQTLTLIHGIQLHEGDYAMVAGHEYELLGSTTLFGLANSVTTVDDTAEVDATFHRLIDPVTGLVVP